jgi:tetratricopeptide (TPR) repeat protein
MGMTVFGGLSADELHNANSATYDEFFDNSLDPGSTAIANNIWRPAYNYIYQANALVSSIDKSTGLSPTTVKQVKGEALFIRAFCYFYLVNLFGDVPLVLGTDYKVNTAMPRLESTLVYQQIVKDLLEAQQLLTPIYPANNKGRVNQSVVTALLARVYLYTGRYSDAANNATTVLNNTSFSLTNSLDSVFLANSKEALWQLIPVPATANTAEGTAFIPANNVVPNYELTSGLTGSFAASDKRRTSWMRSTTVSSNIFIYPYKYKVRTATNVPVTEYYMMMRLAEQYLIRAEAYGQQGNLPSAIADVDKLRQRAGIPLIATINPTISQQALIDTISVERRRELYAEWGHRWFDLKRTGKADVVLGSIKQDWQTTDALYPIPHAQILANPNLKQNPGY